MFIKDSINEGEKPELECIIWLAEKGFFSLLQEQCYKNLNLAYQIAS